jgi:hypothetical protein
MRPLTAQCQFGLISLHNRTGNAQGADEARAVAESMYRDMDMTYWLRHVDS